MEGNPEEILLPPPPKKGEEMLLPPPPAKKKSSGQTYGGDSETLPDAVPFVSASPYKPGGTEEILTNKKPQPIKTFTGELPKIDTTTGVDAAELEGEKQKKQAIQDLNIPEPAKIISPYGEELDPIEAFNKGISDNDKAIRTYSNQLKVESGALAPEEFINELETNYRLAQKTEQPADPTGLSWLTNLAGGQAVNIGGAIGLSIINPLLSIAYGGTAAGAGAAGSTLQNNYMEYRAQGLSPEEAYANAVETAKSSFGFGAVEGSAGALVPGGGAATGIRAAAKDIAKDATFDALLATASQGAQNEIEQNKGLVRELTDGMLENATGEVVFSVLMGAFTKAPAALRNRSKVKYEIAQNSDEKIDQELKTRIENGDITPEQADEAFGEIKQYKETLAKVPDNLSDEAKQQATELLQKREEIEKSIEGKDEALVQAQKEEIKAINDQLINLSNGKNQAEGREKGRQDVLTPPQEDTGEAQVSPVVETAPTGYESLLSKELSQILPAEQAKEELISVRSGEMKSKLGYNVPEQISNFSKDTGRKLVVQKDDKIGGSSSIRSQTIDSQKVPGSEKIIINTQIYTPEGFKSVKEKFINSAKNKAKQNPELAEQFNAIAAKMEELINRPEDLENFLIISNLNPLKKAIRDEKIPREIQDFLTDFTEGIKGLEQIKQNNVLLDQDFEPAIYMHSGPEGITEFRKPGSEGYKKNDELTGQEGIYFTRNLDVTDKYSGKEKPQPGKDIYYTYLKAKKPYYIKDKFDQEQYPLKSIETITSEDRKALEALGYDAVILDEEGAARKEVVVFEPDQIVQIATYNKGKVLPPKAEEAGKEQASFDVENITDTVVNSFEKAGYDVVRGGLSKTDFGESSYLYVAKKGSEAPVTQGIKVRISDHGVENVHRIMNEVHINLKSIFPIEKQILDAQKEVDLRLYPEYFEKIKVPITTTQKVEINQRTYNPDTDKILSERKAKRGGIAYTVERTKTKYEEQIVDKRDGYNFTYLGYPKTEELTTPAVSDWSKDVESTAKALDKARWKNEGKSYTTSALPDEISDVLEAQQREQRINKDLKIVKNKFDEIIDKVTIDKSGYIDTDIETVLGYTHSIGFYINKDKKGNYSVTDKTSTGKGYPNQEVKNLSKKQAENYVLERTRFHSSRWMDELTPEFTAEAYHKAKADGSNPELVAAVEELLGKPGQLTTPAETINTTEAQETENKEDITNISEQTINNRENEDFKKEEKTEVSEPQITQQPEDTGASTDNKGNADTGGKGELSVSERDNLAKIEAETGDNFRVIQNVYNKYDGAKPLSEITTEDYLKAKEKRENDPERIRRRFTKQVLKDESIPNNVKQAFTEDAIYYDRLPNSITAKTAKQLLGYLGTANAQKEVMDLGNGMPSAVRFVMAQEILSELRTEGDYDTFNDFLEKFVPLTTDFGQGIQALSLYGQSNPETNIRKVQKMVQEQREKRIKKSKAAKVVKEIKKINTEAANEAINKTKEKIKKAAGIKPEINSSAPSYGRKNKIVTKERYEQLKKELKGKLFSSPVPPELIEIGVFHIEAGAREFKDFAKVMMKDFGKKIRPYLKSIYKKSTDKFDDKEGFDDDYTVDERLEKLGQDEADKIIRSLLKSGKKSDAKRAIEEINLIPNKKSVWGRYKTASIGRLKKLLLSEIQSDIDSSPILKAFTDGLTKNISQQILEAQGAENKPKKPSRTPIEIISDAYRNFEKYQEVWEETQRQIQEQFKDNPEKLNELDSYFGDILNNPFSEKLVSQSVKSGMKDLDIKIEEIVRQHYTVYDYTKTKLVDKLIREAGLSDAEAKELSNAIEKEFDKIATEKKQQILGRIFTDKQRKKPEIRTLEQKIIELTNLGAFEDEEIIKKYADAFGFPKLTPENIEKITELSNRIQETADGFEKFRAIEDLLSYQASLKGVSWWEIPMSLWYSSMLSGPNTQLRNFVANASSALLLYSNAIAQNPKASTMIAKGFINGVSKGLFEASETLKTGYSPIRGKVEVPTVLERTNFKGLLSPLNSAKYVRRVMVAADVLFFEGLREMRAYQLAYKKAIEKGKLEPDKDLINSAYEILNKSDGSLELAQEQAEAEYQRKIQDIESSDADNKQFLRKQAERDKKRRVYELIEQGRTEDFSKETSTFASKGTYNYPPDGVLGAMARSFNQFSEKVPLSKLIVPFTNIIANVFNETLNYTPIGLLASQTKGGLFVKPKTELTPQEKVDQMVKGVIGTALLTTLLLMTQDDEEFEITANGTGDYRKNYELKELGWQPYSIKYKNKWYSYQYSPLMLAFSMIGNVRDVEKYRKEKLTDNGLWTKFGVAMGATSRAALDQTFLSSANSFLSAALDPRNENAMEDLLRSMQKTATAAVIPAIYSQTAKEMEEIFNIPAKEVRGTWMGSILKDIPVARDQYFNKVNALGEDIVPTNNIFINSTKQDKIWDLIVKNKAWIGVPPPSSTTLVEIKDGKPVERVMTDSEYYNFAKERGSIIKAQIQARYKELEKLEPEQVRKQISDIKADATKSAKLVVLGLIKKFEEVWEWDEKNEVWIEKN